MVYKRFQNEEGNYIDANKQRWDILEAHEAWTPQGINAGWDEYANIQIAAKAYHLTYKPLTDGEYA